MDVCALCGLCALAHGAIDAYARLTVLLRRLVVAAVLLKYDARSRRRTADTVQLAFDKEERMGPVLDSVMIVDDEEGVRQLLSRWLSAWGYEARAASSAADAIEQLTLQPASIVLCDVMMPVHDGLWLAEQIARLWPNTAVIMASGAQDMNTVTRSRKQGAIDFVTKPFGREMLLQALRRAGERRERLLAAV